jgi:hypothetical protein
MTLHLELYLRERIVCKWIDTRISCRNCARATRAPAVSDYYCKTVGTILDYNPPVVLVDCSTGEMGPLWGNGGEGAGSSRACRIISRHRFRTHLRSPAYASTLYTVNDQQTSNLSRLRPGIDTTDRYTAHACMG